jgi:hypothetical protein
MICGIAAGVAAVAAFGAFAFVSGWGASNRAGNATAPHAAPEPVLIAVPEYGQRAGVLMPDVRGLNQAEARQALSDAGVPGEIVAVEERPAAGVPGVVIQQTPVQGVSIDNAAQVLLVVSTPAVVPDVVGLTPAEGASELMGMGVRVNQVRVYAPGAQIGRIVSTVPGSGAGLPEEIVFNVADKAAELQLADKEPTTSRPSTSSQVEINGVQYEREISLTGNEDPATTSWLISGNGVEMLGSAALNRRADDDDQAVLRILGDGRELHRVTLTSKTPVALPTINVSGVQTLTVTVTAVQKAGETRPRSVTVSLLDLKLLGSYDQIAAVK